MKPRPALLPWLMLVLLAWSGPNVRWPVRAESPRWETVAQAEGYRIQRHRTLRWHRLVSPSNLRLAWGGRAHCEERLARHLAPPADGRRPNLPFWTLGGLQFWGDEMWYCGWRIQCHALDGHCRLLTPRGVRRAWGAYEDCEAAFRRLVDRTAVRPRSDQFVVLLHGLLETRHAFRRIEKALAQAGYETVTVKYASTRTSIDEQAAQLERLLARLEGARRIHFVTHSLGGIVVRQYLAAHRDARIGRLVMIAPPNQGAVMADLLADRLLYKALTGPAGQQLLSDSDGFIAALPAPWCEFGVIAAGLGDGLGFSPLIPGDDDGVVGVAETRLEGMRDFLVVPATHGLVTTRKRTIQAVLTFLQTGRFEGSVEKSSEE